MIRALAIALSLCGCKASVAEVVVRNDSGGRLGDYIERRADLISSGQSVRFSGRIASAATILISIPDSCTERDAVFVFHAASNGSGQINYEATSYMASLYPFGLFYWFYASGASLLNGNDALSLTAADLVAMQALEFCE